MKTSTRKIKPEEFKEWNEKMVDKYDPDSFHHHHNLLVRYIERKRVQAIFKLIAIRSRDRVIEVGCGAGNIIEKAPRGILFGADLSRPILNKAKRRMNKEAFLLQADAQNLPCQDRIFERVICSEVLEHLLDPSAALREIARVLKNQGIAVVSFPNESLINRIKTLLIRLGIFKWLFQEKGNYQAMPEKMEDEWHLHALPLREWLDLFGKLFRVCRMKRIPFWWLPLRYVLRLEKIE
jgi:ubiquinone/menaquinone biosynthesis C-methylase UbiE